MRKELLLILFLLYGLGVWAGSGLKISGKIRTLRPTMIWVENLHREVLAKAELTKDGVFTLEIENMQADVYRLWIGKTCQDLFLTPGEVTVKGFYDEQNMANTSLDFQGIEAYQRIVQWLPTQRKAKERRILPQALKQLTGVEIGALAYLSDLPTYEQNRELLDAIPAAGHSALVVEWLAHQVDSLRSYALGVEAYDFTFTDPTGKAVSLHDFRGKLVLIDFWASWCGPCCQEMKSLEPIYREVKNEDLEFISVSLDSREQDWKKILEVEKLPWVMLWDKEGFGKSPEHLTALQKAYGFYSIPFIVLLDCEGKLIARGLRGEKVKTAILEARGKYN